MVLSFLKTFFSQVLLPLELPECSLAVFPWDGVLATLLYLGRSYLALQEPPWTVHCWLCSPTAPHLLPPSLIRLKSGPLGLVPSSGKKRKKNNDLVLSGLQVFSHGISLALSPRQIPLPLSPPPNPWLGGSPALFSPLPNHWLISLFIGQSGNNWEAMFTQH